MTKRDEGRSAPRADALKLLAVCQGVGRHSSLGPREIVMIELHHDGRLEVATAGGAVFEVDNAADVPAGTETAAGFLAKLAPDAKPGTILARRQRVAEDGARLIDFVQVLP
jgi:hypothetical protein